MAKLETSDSSFLDVRGLEDIKGMTTYWLTAEGGHSDVQVYTCVKKHLSYDEKSLPKQRFRRILPQILTY